MGSAPKIFKLLRVNFLPASVLSFFIGVALAVSHGYDVNWMLFLLGLSGVVSAHLAGNAANNYYDHLNGADGPHTLTTPFFGGTRVITEGSITPVFALKTSLALGTAAFMSGAAIFVVTGDPVFVFMALSGAVLALQYTAKPLRLSYRGLGELVIFFLFGPFIVTGGYYLVSGVFSIASLIISIIPGGLILGVIICNEIPDIVTDGRAGKNNLAVILGFERVRLIYASGILLSAFFLAYSVIKGFLPFVSLVSVFFYLPALFLPKGIDNSLENVSVFVKASRSVIMAHSLVSVILILVLLYAARG